MNKNYEYYLKANVDKYIGQWIAICKNKIVAHGKNVKEVYYSAKKVFPRDRPLIVRIPDKETMIF